MAAPHFEQGRQSEMSTELTRILERCIKESRCVDTESLCIMAGVKVIISHLLVLVGLDHLKHVKSFRQKAACHYCRVLRIQEGMSIEHKLKYGVIELCYCPGLLSNVHILKLEWQYRELQLIA